MKPLKKPICLICVKDNKVLLVQRAKNDSFGGWWNIPGGGAEEGETAQETIRREIKEELDCTIENLRFYKEFDEEHDDHNVHAVYFTGSIAGEITLDHENDNYGWFSLEEMEQMQLIYTQKEKIKEFLRGA